MAQPSKEREILIEEHPDMGTQFDQLHRDVYLPIQHGMMILSLLGFASSLHCLYTRWPQFRQKEFSPAHVAFIFPLLSHTNAVQAYRAGVDSFSNLPVKSPFKTVLFAYWLACLLVGTGQHDMSEAEPSGVANQAYILDRYGTFDSTDGDRLCNDVADDEVAGRDNHLGPGKEGQSRHYRSRTWGAWI